MALPPIRTRVTSDFSTNLSTETEFTSAVPSELIFILFSSSLDLITFNESNFNLSANDINPAFSPAASNVMAACFVSDE